MVTATPHWNGTKRKNDANTTMAISRLDLFDWIEPHCENDAVSLLCDGGTKDFFAWVYGVDDVAKVFDAWRYQTLSSLCIPTVNQEGKRYDARDAKRIGMVAHRGGYVTVFCIDLDDHEGGACNVGEVDNMDAFLGAKAVRFSSKSGKGFHCFYMLATPMPVAEFLKWSKAWGFNGKGRPECFPKTEKLTQVWLPNEPNEKGGDTYLSGTFESCRVQSLPIPPEPPRQEPKEFPAPMLGDEGRPGTAFAKSDYSWADILTGATCLRDANGRMQWRRPRKPSGNLSATTGVCVSSDGRDRLYVFSTDWHPFEQHRCYDKFAAYAYLHHNKDFKAAARAVAAMGFGTPSNGQHRNGTAHKQSPPENSPEPWPELQPLPPALPPVAAFDYDLLPGSLRAFVSDIAERMQCPPDFPAVSMMIVAAGVLGNRICIRPKRRDDWTVVPNLWGCIVGRPGIMKTPAAAEGVKFLHRLEAEKREAFQARQDAYEIEKAAYEIVKKARNDAIKRAVAEGTDPVEAAKSFPASEPVPPTEIRYVVNDSTVAKLGVMLQQNPRGLTIFRDELVGLLRDLDREGHESDRAFYLEGWTGNGKFTVDRVTRGTTFIESVTLSILGGIQPGVLETYLREAFGGGKGDDGFVQRFQLGVYPDVSKDFVNIDRWPNTQAKGQAWATFQRIDTLDAGIVNAERDDPESPAYLRFTDEAQDIFDEWYTKLNIDIRSGKDHPVIEAHRSKYKSLVPSLALLIHLADGGIGPVGTEPLQRAIGWAGYLETHARRIYSIVTGCESVIHEIVRRIKTAELLPNSRREMSIGPIGRG